MRNLRMAVAALFVFAVCPAIVAAQQGTITGRVTDAQSGQPLSAAQVFIQGTNIGGLTNADGRFLILNVPVGTREVSAVLVGYSPETATVTVTEGAAAQQDFVMSQSAIALDAVVVTATGEQRKVEIGNALATLDVADIVDVAPITNMSDLLKGRSAGVVVASSSGTTGMGNRIRIRGSSSISLSNEPLIYVDGIRIESGAGSISIGTGGQDISRLDDINPEEIESIEIVKGPSAATLYGTDAANGVIRITTKRGRAGEVRFNVWSEAGQIEDRNDYPLNYAGLDSSLPSTDNRAEDCRVTHVLAGDCVQSGVSAYTPLFDPELTPLDKGSRNQIGASASGGESRVTYFISGEYEREEGALQTPEFYFDDLAAAGVESTEASIEAPNLFERKSFRLNLTSQIADNATAALSAGYVSADRRFPINDNSSGGLFPSAFFGGAFPDRPDDAWGFFTPGQVFGQLNQQNIQRFTSSFTGTFNPVPFVTLRGTAGLDFSSRHDVSHEPPTLESANDEGNRSSDFTEIYQYTADVNGTTNFDVTESITSRSTLGFQYFQDIFHGTRGNGSQLVPGSRSLATAASTNVSETTSEDRTAGVFFEQQFGLNDRLYVTGAVRADDNSAFGQDFDLIWYPKASVSWIASDEPFFPQIDFLNMFRVRGAWGASGRQPGSTAAIQTLSVDAIADPSDNIVSGVNLGASGNVLLKPERSEEWEFGADADMFNGRMGFEFTWFKRTTSDIIVNEPLPPSLGSSASRSQNLGEAETSGFELGVSGTVLDMDNVSLDLSFSGSKLDSQLNELGLVGVDFIGGNRSRHAPGFPLGSAWDFPYTFADTNGDGMIEAGEVTMEADRVFIGAGLPETEFTISSTLRLGDYVQLYALMDSQRDYVVFNNTEGFRCQFRVCQARIDVNAPLWDQARHVARDITSTRSDFDYYEKGNFTKLREVSVTLFLPQNIAARMRASRASLTLSGRNLVTWTSYTGVDPELNRSGSSDNFGTEEFLTQGIPRYLTARLNFVF